MLNKKDLEILKREYIRLIVKVGLNIKKGQKVHLSVTNDDLIFNRLFVEECYKAGASRVYIDYRDPYISRLNYLYADKNDLKNVKAFELDRYKYLSKPDVVDAFALADDFEAMNGVNQALISEIDSARSKIFYPYHLAHSTSSQWSGFAVATYSWAHKLFPKLDKEKALLKLWELIFKCSYVSKKDTIKNWIRHNKELDNKAKYLNSLNIKSLHYTNKLGTDLTVGLIPNSIFIGGGHFANNRPFNPNFPTEEVFNSPDRMKTNGIVYSSKPLVIDGTVIKDFYLKFKNGKVVDAHAKVNEKKLLDALNEDKNARYLGEVALVPISSPINQSNILFYETLFDENASCHLAFGQGFKINIRNNEKYSNDELIKLGLNHSQQHIDFMIGTPDLKIEALTKNNKKIIIFKNGTWAK